jgi:hypothetical protein
MHAGPCRTFDEVLGFCSLSGGLSQEPHSDAIDSWQDSVRGMASLGKEAIFEHSPYVRMRSFRAGSEMRDESSWIPEPLPAYSLGTAYRPRGTSYMIHSLGCFTAPEMWYVE